MYRYHLLTPRFLPRFGAARATPCGALQPSLRSSPVLGRAAAGDRRPLQARGGARVGERPHAPEMPCSEGVARRALINARRIGVMAFWKEGQSASTASGLRVPAVQLASSASCLCLLPSAVSPRSRCLVTTPASCTVRRVSAVSTNAQRCTHTAQSWQSPGGYGAARRVGVLPNPSSRW